MVIMSKGSRLTERPKPPTWEETIADVETASPTDIVFSIGKDFLPQITGSPSDKGHNSSSMSGTDSECDTSRVDREQVESSYADVLQLLTLNEDMKDAPTSLTQQYAKLRTMGDDMTQAVKDLKEMAQTIPSNVSQDDLSSGSKSKSKPKKKK